MDALTEGQLLKLLVDHINDGIIVMDRSARILWTNAGFSRQTGWSAEEARGRRPQEFLMPQEVRPSQAEIDQFDFDMVPEDFQDFQIVQNMRKDGGRYWVQLAFSQADLQEGVRVICAARDISGQVAAQDALAAAKAELEHSVNSDVLTGLANRRRLGEVLAEALEDAAARDGQVALFHVDLDKFKEVNDTHGHAAGDAILVHAAEAMTRSTREQDLVARVGGDEFVIVMPTAPTPQELAEFARRIIHEVTRPLPWEEVELQCGASIGIAVSDPGLRDGEELIQQADFALYDVKQKGRGSYASYDQALADKHLEKKRMAEDLRRTVGEGGLHFHFQPVLSLATQEIIG
ncbi:MAG: diguanylate cyclase, partial [Pseudomonadota bacterium]